MTTSASPSVLIVGAGSAGLMTGSQLQHTGASVTFLVRPHREEALSRPQQLYSYDDRSLTEYSGYDLLTGPASLGDAPFDFVVVTLDGASLHAEAGQELVEALGRAFCGTTTGFILCSIGLQVRERFLQRSGLASSQVSHGSTATLVHEARGLSFAPDSAVDQDLLDRADHAYTYLGSTGFFLDRSAPQVAEHFTALFDRNGISTCTALPAEVGASWGSVQAVLMAWDLLGWPAAAQIDRTDETWRLGADAMAEIHRLPIFGPAGVAASEQITPQAVHEQMVQMEQAALPMDLAAFNAYHHGGKVNLQDRQFLQAALRSGEDDGVQMPALRTLVSRLADSDTTAR
ncbi:ketopantoate reductase family protein [Geodermatophilus sp. URMC 63]